MGYTYPKFVVLNLADKVAARAAIGARINELYGDGTRKAFVVANAPAIAESAAQLVGLTPANHAAPLAAMKLFAFPAAATSTSPQAPLSGPSPTSAEGATYTD